MDAVTKQSENQQQLIVVLGMHRSGTSAITRGLQVAGVSLGNRLMPPISGVNDKGFWEDLDIVLLNEHLLASCGRTWDSLDPVVAADVDSLCEQGYLQRAIELLRSKTAVQTRFGFKDPRTAKMLPFWVRVFLEGGFAVRYVLALRNPVSVAKSLAKRDGFAFEKSYYLWVEHLVVSLANIDLQDAILLDYDQLMSDPDGELRRVVAWLGAGLDAKDLELYRREFLDEALRHSRFAPNEVDSDECAPALVREVNRFFSDVVASRAAVNQAFKSDQVERWVSELQRLRPVFRMYDALNRQVARLSREATVREELIASLNDMGAEYERRISDLNQAAGEREGLIASLNRIASEHEGLIASLNSSASEREELIASLNSSAAERDELIASLDHDLAARDADLAEVRRRLKEAERKIATLVALRDRYQSSRTYRVKRGLALMKWRRQLAHSPLFNAEWYLQNYPDVASAGLDPLKHYLTNGWREGRRPGPEFDGEYYVARYHDIEQLDVPPLVHYWLHGRFEGRRMNAALDVEWQAISPASDSGLTGAEGVADAATCMVPEISVIIPTYNRIKLLPDVVAAWREVHACTKIPYEIIFSDDGSEDGSPEFLETIRDLPIKVLRNPHGGASSARNAAIRFATGRRLLIIGDDIFPDPELLNVHADLGAKLGNMVATLGSVDWHEELPVNHLMHHITEVGNEQFSYNRLQDGAYVDFRHFYTCNICVPQHFFAVESVIFDERFNEYGFEDIELGYRLALRGLKIYFTTAATGEHYHPYKTLNFCRRQISAGRMAVVFARMHPGVRQLIGITDSVRRVKAQDDLWQGRVDQLVRRCDEYEHLIESLPRDLSAGLRGLLSVLYTHLFRAMYQYGVLQKQGLCEGPLTVAMTDHFSGLGADYWRMLDARADKAIRLPIDEACNLGEALITGRVDDLLYGNRQREVFDELVHIRKLSGGEGSRLALQRLSHLLSRGLYHLFTNPRHLLARIRQRIYDRNVLRPPIVALPVTQTPFVEAIPGLVVNADDPQRAELIRGSRAVFGDTLQIYELTEGGMLMRLDEADRPSAPARPEDVEATVLFWPETTRFVEYTDRLLSAYMAVIENGLGMALISHSLNGGARVLTGGWRDHVVFSRAVASAVLTGLHGGIELTGKILRLLPAWGNEEDHDLDSLLGQELSVTEDGFFSSRAGQPKSAVRYRPPYLPRREKTRPVVFVFPIFLAVGGVERNTVEIMRELRDRFDFVVITMERLRAEQGSLSGQAQEVAARVIEMAEIVRHGDYLRVLSRLKTNLQPDLVWVCNGSPWFCDNAEGIRRIFNDIPIIDQEVYDVEKGWISRYAEAGIRSFDAFIAINKKIEARFLGDFGIDRRRVHLIYSAIDTVRIRKFKATRPGEAELRKKFGLPADKQLYIFVARLTAQKRPVDFLKLALRRIQNEDEFFVLVGDGELATEADEFIDKHKLDNVKRIPYIENTLELNAISSGIVFTSAYEGLPIAMLEAIALGVPSFATDVGDIANVLHQYGGGEVFPVNMPADDVAAAFEVWRSRRDEYAASLRSRDDDILERFSSRNIAGKYVACWQEAMDEYRGRAA